jgi:K+-sensing histidine kinase KdpD
MRRVGTLAFALFAVAITTFVAVLLRGLLGLEEIVMLYLLAIMVVALRTDRAAALVASLLSVASFDFFAVPPYLTFAVKDVRHLLTFLVMFLVGLVIANLTAQVRRAKLEEIRSSILSAVSHDFRTPLATITGAATTLRQGASSLAEPERADMVQTICEEAERLERLLAKVLAMTRLEAGVQPDTQAVPLEELLGAALTRLEQRLTQHEVELRLGEVPFVACDPVLFEQVFLNLLENVVRHTPAGTHVIVSAHEDGGWVVVEIADDGPGLPEEVRARLFQKFVRSAGSIGVGLGLAIVRGIVEAHHGRVALADSTRGTRFIIHMRPAGEHT